MLRRQKGQYLGKKKRKERHNVKRETEFASELLAAIEEVGLEQHSNKFDNTAEQGTI